MEFPHLAPFRGKLPRKPHDPNDPRALELLEPWDRKSAPAIGVVGVPFDGAVTGRKGASGGPAGIREAFRYSSTYHWGTDREIPLGTVADLGDIEIGGDSTHETHAAVRKALAGVLRADIHPIVLGGDNSITWATVGALVDAVEGRVGILDLDAHLDVRVSEPAVNSGTPFRRIIEDFGGRVAPANIAQVGHRQFANSRPYRTWAQRHGIRLFDMDAVARRGFSTVLDEAVEAAGDGTDHLVLTVDMDAVDQAYAPGVSAPTPSGLLPDHLFATMRRMAKEPRTRLAEIVEVAPSLDPTGNTARLAAVACLEYMVHRAGAPTKRS